MTQITTPSVNEVVLGASRAYRAYAALPTGQRQIIIDKIKERLLPLAEELGVKVATETGIGVAAHKAEKIRLALNKTPGIEDLETSAVVDDYGMTLYERSAYGVVCAIHPVNNPVSTLINNTISALAAGNTIVHCPHPMSVEISLIVTQLIRDAIAEVCTIKNLVTIVADRKQASTREVTEHPDVAMIVATGSRAVLMQAMHANKKLIGAGPANPVTIVDDSADVAQAARDIVTSAAFDNNLTCVSEKCVVVHEAVAAAFARQLQALGACYLSRVEEMLHLTKAVIRPDMLPNRILDGRDPEIILERAGITDYPGCKLIAVECVCQHPFVVNEMMMPILPIVRVATFSEAVEAALEIEQGYRHTAAIHSQSIDHLNEAARRLQTTIFVKNGPCLAGIGYGTQGPASFTVATGSGEGTVTARHFARTRRCTLMKGFNIK